MSNKKIFLSALSLALVMGTGYANAQLASIGGTQAASSSTNKAPVPVAEPLADEAILFKIQDISPVKNSDGKVTSCDYSAVFFNRTNDTLTGASLDFIWEDKTLEELANEDKPAEDQRARSYNNRTTDENKISSSIEISNIKSLRQATIRSRIQSDRCFVLMEEMTVKPKSCTMELVYSSGGKTTKNCG
ncbi:MAG: hypothetical protein ACK5N8_06110 [Alphaproteobacteria bacterium]